MKNLVKRILVLCLVFISALLLGLTSFGADECAEHKFSGWKVTKTATCKEKGEMTRTCSVCGEKETLSLMPAHNFVTKEVTDDCTKGGVIRSACGTCGLVESETPFEGKAHIFGETVTDKAPTCTEDGSRHTSCVVCGLTNTETLPKSGHNKTHAKVLKEATCTEEGHIQYTCTVCLVDIDEATPALGHAEQLIEGKKPTCDTEGLSDGKFCTRCRTTYVNQEILPALGHEKIDVPRLEPTCTVKGLTESTVCKNCGEVYKRAEDIPPKGHTRVTAPGVSPTCTKEGYTEHDKCADCDHLFTEPAVLPKLNHEHKVLRAVPSTCTKTGLTEGLYCAECDLVIVKQEVTPPAGHSEVYYRELTPTCTESGYRAGKRCSVCGIIIVGLEELPALGHTESITPGIPAGCTTVGKSEKIVCLVCDKLLKDHTIVPATGHYPVVDYAVAPTCAAEGLTEGKHCITCKTVLVEQKPVAKTDHYIIAIDAIDATCTKSGKTSGERCAVCDLIVKNPKTTLPLGHVVKARTTASSFTSDGSTETYCERCDSILSSTPIKKVKAAKLSADKYTYDGKRKTPSVTVTDTSGKKLIKDTDYTLTYSSGRTNVGTYKVKVTLKGNYSGSQTYSYTIIPAKVKVTAKQSTNSIKLSWKAVEGAAGYRVYLYNERSGKWETVIKSTKATSHTFKSLDSGKSYKYSVKPYSKNDGTIWGDSTRITVTTNPAKATLNSAESSAKKTVTLKWNKVDGATGYVIYYKTSKNGSYKKLTSTKSNTYTSTKRTSGKTHYFIVKAYIKTSDGYIYSSASNTKSVYVK